MIYLDGASTTPLLPEVRRAMAPGLEGAFGNPSSPHAAGREARRIVEDARETVAAALGADPGGLVFTSGATESNHLAIEGAAEALRERGDHVVTSAIEHPSVLAACARLEARGLRVTRVPVGGSGRVDPEAVARAVTPRTILVSVMWVNNETGAVQPVAELRAAAGDAVLHSDAAQAVGKVPVDPAAVDLLTFSAHKLHGPKGVGGLWIRRGTPLVPRTGGGGQERERRAGTENVAGIAGLAEAVRIACRDRGANAARMAALRDRLRAGLGAPVAGDPGAPHLLTALFEGIEAEAAVLALDAEGICVSSGSACASLSMEPSHVLRAMGVPAEAARGSLRFGITALTTEDEIDRAVEGVKRVVSRLRKVGAGA